MKTKTPIWYNNTARKFSPEITVMPITIEATYENGVLKPAQPLPLTEKQRITVTIHDSDQHAKLGYGLVQWTGSLQDLEYLIEDVENDPLERP